MANNIVKGCGKKNSGYDAVTVSTNYNDNDHIEFMGNVLVDSPAMGFHVIGKGNNDIIIRDNVIIRPKDDPIYAEPDVPPLQQSGNTVVKGD
jgi:hypothetical protein